MPSNKWWLKSSPPNVVHVRSVQHLVDEMAGAGERLVIVDVFAPWCAACKALYPKVRAGSGRIAATRQPLLILGRLWFQAAPGQRGRSRLHGMGWRPEPCVTLTPLRLPTAFPSSSQLMKLMEQRPDVLLLAVNFDENKTVVKAMGVKVRPPALLAPLQERLVGAYLPPWRRRSHPLPPWPPFRHRCCRGSCFTAARRASCRSSRPAPRNSTSSSERPTAAPPWLPPPPPACLLAALGSWAPRRLFTAALCAWHAEASARKAAHWLTFAGARSSSCRREAIERHSTARCILSSGDEEPVLAEFPNVQPAKGVAASLDQTAGQPPPQPQPVA